MRENQKKRFKDVSLVETIIAQDTAWRQLRFVADSYNRIKNVLSKAIGKRIKMKEEVGNEEIPQWTPELDKLTPEILAPMTLVQLITLKVNLDKAMEDNSKSLAERMSTQNEAFKEVGNLLHPSVPVDDNEDNNRVERTWGDIASRKKYSHVDLIVMIAGADLEKGAVTVGVGGRGYYLTGPAVFLQQGLIKLALRMLGDKEYIPLYTPYFMRKEVMQEVSQLSQFDEELYNVVGKGADDKSTDEKYLISTSEQPIAAYHRDEWISESALPLKYAGISSCVKHEAGSHGHDTRGIFRVHQFDKIEQFVIISPLDTFLTMLDEMIGNTEKFCKTFELYSVKTEFGLITNKQPKAVHVVVTSSLKVIIISSVTWKSKLSKKRKLHILEAFICLLIVRVYLTSVLSFFRGEIKKNKSSHTKKDFENSKMDIDMEEEEGTADDQRPGTSVDDHSHPKWGKVGKKKHIHDKRVALFDFLDSAQRNSRNHTDAELRSTLETMMKEANLGQTRNNRQKQKILWRSIPKSNNKNPVRGFYIVTKKGDRSLLTKLATDSKITEKKLQFVANRKTPGHPLNERMNKFNRDTKLRRPTLDIIYTCVLIKPDLIRPNLLETLQPLEDNYVKNAIDSLFVYSGIHNGKMGLSSFRLGHLYGKNSEIYARTKGAPENEKFCVIQLFSRMCESTNTRVTAEAFWLYYQEKVNGMSDSNRFIITATATMNGELLKKANDYVEAKVEMFKFVAPDDPQKLPVFHYCTLSELTTFPLKIGIDEFVVQYDPRDINLKPTLKYLLDVEDLVNSYGKPPELFFEGKEVLKAQFHKKYGTEQIVVDEGLQQLKEEETNYTLEGIVSAKRQKLSETRPTASCDPVWLVAAILLKSGKPLISRNFVKMCESRYVELLAAFPKLITAGKQDTFVETDDVRYVYQPLEKLYLVFITTKASNRLEDLETLRLFAKVIPKFCRNLEEADIIDNACNLLYAFDEIITLGYRENVNLAQDGTTYVEMDSRKKKDDKAVRQSQEKEVLQKMRDNVKEFQRQRLEQQKRDGGRPTASSSSSIIGCPMVISSTDSNQSSGPSRPSYMNPNGSGGMKLGSKSRDVESFVDQLKSEGGRVAPANTSNTSNNKIVSGCGNQPNTESVQLKIEETISLTPGRDGGLQNMEVLGKSILFVQDEDSCMIRIQFDNADNRGIQFQTHPNVDKDLFRNKYQIELKNSQKPFLVNTDVPILKWRYQTTDEARIPLSINCWPSENRAGGCHVNIEYELQIDDLELLDVTISIPVPFGGSGPVVSECEGDYVYEASKNLLLWQLPVIDSSNKSGSMEFSVPNGHASQFFPVQVSFHSNQTFARLSVNDVTSVEDGSAVKHSVDTLFSTKIYEIL